MPLSRHRLNGYIRERRAMWKGLAEYLCGGICEDCGYSGPALQWHHRDPGLKDFKIGGSVTGWAKYWREVQKCDLICANCHIERHANDPCSTMVVHPAVNRQVVGPSPTRGASYGPAPRTQEPAVCFGVRRWAAATTMARRS